MNDVKYLDKDEMTQIFFSGGTPVKESAGFIVKAHEEGKNLQFRAVGAGAVCQMYKAMATARSILATKGLEAKFRPGFENVILSKDGQEKEITVMVGYMDVE